MSQTPHMSSNPSSHLSPPQPVNHPLPPQPPSLPSATPSHRQRGANGRPPTFKAYLRIIVTVLVLLLFLFLVKSFIKPVAMGAVFASILHPLMRRTKHPSLSEKLRAFGLTFLLLVSFLVPVGVLIVAGAQAALERIQSLQDQLTQVSGGTVTSSALFEMLDSTGLLEHVRSLIPLSEGQLHQVLVRALQATGTLASTVFQGLLTDLPQVLLSTLVIVTTVYYLLIDGPHVIDQVKRYSIFKRKTTDKLMETARMLCHSVVLASIANGLAQALIIAVACLVSGTHGVVVITLATFLCSFIPLVGVSPIILFLIGRGFITGHSGVGVTFIVCAGVLLLADNFVRPYVLKGGAKLHPLVGFVAAFASLEAIGFYGLFIGPIVAGLLFALIDVMSNSSTTSSPSSS